MSDQVPFDEIVRRYDLATPTYEALLARDGPEVLRRMVVGFADIRARLDRATITEAEAIAELNELARLADAGRLVDCTEHGCPLPATAGVAGPHGVVKYCRDHATIYESIMLVVGATTERVPLL